MNFDEALCQMPAILGKVVGQSGENLTFKSSKKI